MRLLQLFAAAASLVAAVAGHELAEDDERRSLTGSKPLRVMIVGDSITHGHEGDFTWRYRIWEWFRANNVSVDFVGPYQGTIDRDQPAPPKPPNVIGEPGPPLFSKPRIPWGYADAVPKDFDSDHFSTGGYKAYLAKEVIRDLAKKYQPELILCLIGINDFIWSLEAPEALLESMKTIVDEIRIVNPKAKFAIGNVIWRGIRDAGLDERTAKYNPMLKEAIPGWSSNQSPIHHVDVASAYSCGPDHPHCPGAFDNLHPSTLGNYEIAQVFAQTLIEKFEIGQEPLKIPIAMPVNRSFRPPKNVKAAGSPVGVLVTWDHNFGMTSYKVKWRTEGSQWTEDYVTMNRLDTITETPGILYQYKVSSCHGDRCSRYSEVVEAVSDRHTAPPPTNLHTLSMDQAFQISWSLPENSDKWNITMYEISLRNMAEPGWQYVGSRRFSEKITGFFGLPKGSIWTARLATWTYPEGKGLYTYARPIMEGGGKPTQPQNLQAKYISQNAALLTWNASANAGGYLVYYRSFNEHGRGEFTTDGNVVIGLPRTTIQNLELGRGEYEFCVSAVNGDAESKTSCVAPGKSSIGIYPIDWLGSLSMNSTMWFCALLLVGMFLAMARRRKKLPALFERSGGLVQGHQKVRGLSVFVSEAVSLTYDRVD